ncbi:MAG: CPBP family intramembrane metalloprotease [Legionellaceae bacterium]|nr:CPBP family intramembrane metalloprotease [Legionellaceae bacterium]
MWLHIDRVSTGLLYGLLYTTVIALWIPKFKPVPLWSILLTLLIGIGLVTQHLQLDALLPILLLNIALWQLKKTEGTLPIRVFSGLMILILGVGLMGFLFPGFHNQRVLNQVYISADAIPFTLYLNLDKTILGILIIGWLHPRINTLTAWLSLFKNILPKLGCLILIVGGLSFFLGFVRFDAKYSSYLLIWAPTNLLFVCLAEEAFFRGFIQKYLTRILTFIPYSAYVAIGCAAILFGLAHYKGGVQYMFLATVAGIGYGWAYFKTKKIEAAILIHFLLNLIHFLFFTYPALAHHG